MRNDQLSYSHPSFAGLIGVAQRDITPPVGIYARMWGAATNDVAEGVHRPLTATALVLRTRDDESPFVLISLDLGWWKQADDEWLVRGRVLERLGIDESRVLINLSHTHSAPPASTDDADRPGGELIGPYLSSVTEAVAAAAQEAAATVVPATLSWAQGTCTLAQNRDLFDGSRHACGFNPSGKPDNTLLVGRVTGADGKTLATIANYACHPTTLAWQNRMISPDFIGAARELVERETGGAPFLFLQGASGELAPREMYTGDTSVPDRNGRTLGHAILSILSDMLPHSTVLRYNGVVESGAQLATWKQERFSPSETAQAVMLDAILPLKKSWEADEPDPLWGQLPERVLEERLMRRRRLARVLDGGRARIWIWRLGDAIVVAQTNECYSRFQTELRRRFSDRAVVVMNLTNGASRGYLPPADAYDTPDIYQVWQSPYERGSLEQVLTITEEGICEHLVKENSPASVSTT